MSTELIDVQMPDGTIVSGVPKGITQAEVLRRYQLSQQSSKAAPSTTAEPPGDTMMRQLTVGASPSELAERFKGVARAAGRVGMGALQYGQYLTGAKVSPTPLFLEPSPDPNQHIGEKIGETVLAAAPVAATGGTSLPTQAAVGSAVGGMVGGQTGAVVGGAVPVVAKAAGEVIDKVAQYVSDKELAAKLWNAVAKVKAGRQGTQLDQATGEFKTLPGRSMVDEDLGPLPQVAKAFLAKPNAATQAAAYTELQNAGNSLGKQLAKVSTPIDITADLPLSEPKVVQALEAVGVKPGLSTVSGPNLGNGITGTPYQVSNVTVTPTQAHAIRSDLGSRINWNPNVYNDTNEALKDAYFKIGDKLDSVLPETIKPALKRWQESYLFNKALSATMEKAASNPSLIPPLLKRTVIPALIGGGIAGAALKELP